MSAWGFYLLAYTCDACGREAICRADNKYSAKAKMHKLHPGWTDRGHYKKVYCPNCAPSIPKFRMELGKVDTSGRPLVAKKFPKMQLVKGEQR